MADNFGVIDPLKGTALEKVGGFDQPANAPPAEQATQLEPSQGDYSGGFTKGGSAAGSGGSAGSGSLGSQWMRQISLVVSGSGTGAAGGANQGLELATLRVSFNIHKNTNQTPNILDARVFNLSPETMSKITQFTRVTLSAGYKYGQYGVIYDGAVTQYRKGRENQTDTYMEIIGADGRLSDPVSFHRWDPPMKESEPLQQLIKDTNIPVGYIDPSVGSDQLKRPWIVAGSTQTYLRQLMQKYNARCFPDMGKLYIVKQREIMPGEAVVLTPQTGLIGIPEATPNGIQVRCLLNPKLRLGCVLKLDNKLISGVAFMPGTQDAHQTIAQMTPNTAIGKKLDIPVPTSPIGLYKIYMMEISGDTRGVPWYCDMICLAVGSDGKVVPTGADVFSKQG